MVHNPEKAIRDPWKAYQSVLTFLYRNYALNATIKSVWAFQGYGETVQKPKSVDATKAKQHTLLSIQHFMAFKALL